MKWQFEIELDGAVDTPDAIAVVFRTKDGVMTQFLHLSRSGLPRERCAELLAVAGVETPIPPSFWPKRDERSN